MAAFSKAGSSTRRWTLSLSVLTFALVMAVGVLLWQAVELTSLATVAAMIAGIKPIADGMRLLLIDLLALFWPRLVAYAARARNANGNTRSHWLALRWRVTGWLFGLELVLGQDLLGRFLGAI